MQLFYYLEHCHVNSAHLLFGQATVKFDSCRIGIKEGSIQNTGGEIRARSGWMAAVTFIKLFAEFRIIFP